MNFAGAVAESGFPHRWVLTFVEHWLYRGKSPFQQIDIGEAGPLGRCLFLDGWLQLAEADEHIYHEHLVLPALLAHPHPERVLVLGGGDGLAVREALRHRAVRQVTVVDIDEQVVTACRTHLGSLQQGALDDPRVQVLIKDARRYLRQTPARFDVVLVDLVDFTPDSLALYADILDHLPRVLQPGGIVVGHGPDPGPPHFTGLYLVAFLGQRFPATAWFTGFVGSFGEPWTFVFAAAQPLWAALSPRAWQERAKALVTPPRSFLPENLPAMLRHPSAEEERIRRFGQRPLTTLPEPAWHARVLHAEAAQRLFGEFFAPKGE